MLGSSSLRAFLHAHTLPSNVALADAEATLRQCRLVRPAFWKRSWLERLFTAPAAYESMPVTDVVAAQMVSSEYAAGE